MVLGEQALQGAAEAGCLRKLQWLSQQASASAVPLGTVTGAASKGGNVAMLSWLAEQGCTFRESDLQ
jgi:hypothetical protein